MKILVTGDDGIFAEGLWALVKELKNSFDVIVVAPDRKRNAVGTATTVDRPIRVKRVQVGVDEVETWAVEGTPLDCVQLAIHKFAKDNLQMVVSGINEGPNQDGDIAVSGTVAAAFGALTFSPDLSAIAISQDLGSRQYFDTAAKFTVVLAEWINSRALPSNILLNVNVPNLPLSGIRGIKITQLADGSIYEDSVEEGGSSHIDKDHGYQGYYSLVRRREKKATDRRTDIWATQHGYISITPLYALIAQCPITNLPQKICRNLFQDLKRR